MVLIDWRCVTQLRIEALPAAFSTRCSFTHMESLLGRNFPSTDCHNEPIETSGGEHSKCQIDLNLFLLWRAIRIIKVNPFLSSLSNQVLWVNTEYGHVHIILFFIVLGWYNDDHLLMEVLITKSPRVHKYMVQHECILTYDGKRKKPERKDCTYYMECPEKANPKRQKVD